MNEWFSNGEFPKDEIISLERFCLKNTYSSSKIPAFYYFVRNCLCHGNFEIRKIGRNNYLVLEDNTGSVIRGRGTIKIDTLVRIAETIINYQE